MNPGVGAAAGTPSLNAAHLGVELAMIIACLATLPCFKVFFIVENVILTRDASLTKQVMKLDFTHSCQPPCIGE